MYAYCRLSDPVSDTWNESSRLAFNAAVQQYKHVFLVTAVPPLDTNQFHVVTAPILGIESGYWAVPLGAAVRSNTDGCQTPWGRRALRPLPGRFLWRNIMICRCFRAYSDSSSCGLHIPVSFPTECKNTFG